MKIASIFTFLIAILLFTGCSTKNVRTSSYSKEFPPYNIYNDSKDYKQKYAALSKFYDEWKHVKYKFGGNTKSGIDCSAFVQHAFNTGLNIKIPRTTAKQNKIGVNVSKAELQMGDLVFFKTGRKSRHVGIYLEGGKFMHSSTSQGVTISRLDNVYYKRHFWKIKRVID